MLIILTSETGKCYDLVHWVIMKHIYYISKAYTLYQGPTWPLPKMYSLWEEQSPQNIAHKVCLQPLYQYFWKMMKFAISNSKVFKDMLTRTHFQTWNRCATTRGSVPWGPFCTGKYHPDVATWKAFTDLHTLFNMIRQWPSSLVQRGSTNVAENAISQHGNRSLVSAFTLVIKWIMLSD